jgi:hypothetical protein
VSEAARAARLDELLRLLAANDCGVATVMPYAWTTQEVNPADQSHWFGLAEPRTAVVRPSGAALRAAVTALRAAPPAVQPGACGRPDLPGLRLARPAPRPFRLRAARACRARRATVRWTTGALAEPLRAFSLRVGRRLVRRSDPDGAGTAPVPTSVQVTVPRGGARLAIRAYDELGVERARASLRVPACASRASDGAPTARPESAARTMKMSALDRT